VNTIYTQTKQKAVVREQLPIYLILAGIAASIAAAGDLLLGRNLGEETTFIWTGLAVLGSGLVLDLTVGERSTIGWLKEASAARQDLGKFLLVSIQLGLLTYVIYEYHIGNQAFYEGIAVVTFLGFLVHNFLPLAFRLPFFSYSHCWESKWSLVGRLRRG